MTTDEAFIQAIRAEPDDDALRLIYADWLQEQDDPACQDRGEFIRVQCQLARMWSEQAGWLELKKRERSLLARYWDAWIGPLRTIVGSTWELQRGEVGGRFQRGFIEVLTLNANTFLRRAHDLFRLTPLQHLRLLGAGPLAATLANSSYLEFLTVLEFNDYFSDPVDAVGACALAASPHLRRLRVLNLFGNNLGPEGAAALAAATWLPRLAELNLNNNGIGDYGGESLAAIAGLTDLRRLELAGNGITDLAARALAYSPALGRVRTLNLAGNAITAAGRRELQESPYLTGLTYLDLDRNPCAGP
jgi:uncharacterized protein (TIGR02996 family)